MPRRGSNTGDSSLTRRCSARIAATKSNETPSPVKKTRRSSNRQTANKVEYAEDGIEQNGNEHSSKASSSAEEPIKKKLKPNESSEKPSKSEPESADKDDLLTKNASPSKSKLDSSKDAGAEVADQSCLTKPDSEEVKSVTSAQDKDGPILAGGVQVSKDDIPDVSENITAVLEGKSSANATEINSHCKGDDCSSTERFDATDSEQKDVESQLEKPLKDGISQ